MFIFISFGYLILFLGDGDQARTFERIYVLMSTELSQHLPKLTSASRFDSHLVFSPTFIFTCFVFFIFSPKFETPFLHGKRTGVRICQSRKP